MRAMPDLPVAPTCRSDLDPKSVALRAVPLPHEGRFAIVTNVRQQDAMDASHRKTNGADADGEVVWS
jgi:hypothetical protein